MGKVKEILQENEELKTLNQLYKRYVNYIASTTKHLSETIYNFNDYIKEKETTTSTYVLMVEITECSEVLEQDMFYIKLVGASDLTAPDLKYYYRDEFMDVIMKRALKENNKNDFSIYDFEITVLYSGDNHGKL